MPRTEREEPERRRARDRAVRTNLVERPLPRVGRRGRSRAAGRRAAHRRQRGGGSRRRRCARVGAGSAQCPDAGARRGRPHPGPARGRRSSRGQPTDTELAAALSVATPRTAFLSDTSAPFGVPRQVRERPELFVLAHEVGHLRPPPRWATLAGATAASRARCPAPAVAQGSLFRPGASLRPENERRGSVGRRHGREEKSDNYWQPANDERECRPRQRKCRVGSAFVGSTDRLLARRPRTARRSFLLAPRARHR